VNGIKDVEPSWFSVEDIWSLMVVKLRLGFLNALRKKCITVAIVLCSEYLASSPPHETILVDMTLSLEYTRRSRPFWCDWLWQFAPTNRTTLNTIQAYFHCY
jgi:hypothetical protein